MKGDNGIRTLKKVARKSTEAVEERALSDTFQSNGNWDKFSPFVPFCNREKATNARTIKEVAGIWGKCTE